MTPRSRQRSDVHTREHPRPAVRMPHASAYDRPVAHAPSRAWHAGVSRNGTRRRMACFEITLNKPVFFNTSVPPRHRRRDSGCGGPTQPDLTHAKHGMQEHACVCNDYPAAPARVAGIAPLSVDVTADVTACSTSTSRGQVLQARGRWVWPALGSSIPSPPRAGPHLGGAGPAAGGTSSELKVL